jgi:hypothetical protein
MLLGIGLAIAFAVQVITHAAVPMAVGVPPIFTALEALAVATVDAGAQLGPLLAQLATAALCLAFCGQDCIGFCSSWPAGNRRPALERVLRHPSAISNGFHGPTSTSSLSSQLESVKPIGALLRAAVHVTGFTSAFRSSFKTPTHTRSSSPEPPSTASISWFSMSLPRMLASYSAPSVKPFLAREKKEPICRRSRSQPRPAEPSRSAPRAAAERPRLLP